MDSPDIATASRSLDSGGGGRSRTGPVKEESCQGRGRSPPTETGSAEVRNPFDGGRNPLDGGRNPFGERPEPFPRRAGNVDR